MYYKNIIMKISNIVMERVKETTDIDDYKKEKRKTSLQVLQNTHFKLTDLQWERDVGESAFRAERSSHGGRRR